MITASAKMARRAWFRSKPSNQGSTLRKLTVFVYEHRQIFNEPQSIGAFISQALTLQGLFFTCTTLLVITSIITKQQIPSHQICISADYGHSNSFIFTVAIRITEQCFRVFCDTSCRQVAGLIVLIVLCLLHPVLLVILMTIALGSYLFHRSKPKNHQTFLPKG